MLDIATRSYLLNSPRMHVWHHDLQKHGRFGQNYAIVFSLWDWIFGTAYMPEERQQPARLGFKGMRTYPRGLLARLAYPLLPRFLRSRVGRGTGSV